MRTKIAIAAIVVVVAVACFSVKAMLSRRASDPVANDPRPARIVSLSPSITEILFALDLGDRVVGVSQFCAYPAEAKTRTVVGGYLNPNYEAMVGLEPDLVVLRGENEQFVAGFKELGVETLVVRHQTVEGILDSITAIGRRCGAEAEARRLTGRMEEQIRRLEERTAGLKRPRVMIVAERALGTGKIQNAYVAGGDGFLNRMIELAGGKNACPERTVGFPVVSAEGILQMDPEVVVDLIAVRQQAGHSTEALRADWRQLEGVAAVRDGRVHLVDDDFAFIPGPRFVALAEKLARLVHPELTW